MSPSVKQGATGVNGGRCTYGCFSGILSRTIKISGRRPDFRQYAEVGVLSFLEVDMVTAEQLDFLTVSEAARVIGATRGMVHHHRLTGKLPTIRVDGVYLISRESVEQLRRERAAFAERANATTGS